MLAMSSLIKPTTSQRHAKRAVVFLRLAAREGDPNERARLIALAKHAKGLAKLYRMVERRGTQRGNRGLGSASLR